MTELSFLLDILLNHKLPKATQIAIKGRIDEIQANPLAQIPTAPPSYQVKTVPAADSSLPNSSAVAEIAQTPAAQAALAHRQAMINAAMSQKPMPGSTSAPKTHGQL